MFDRNSHERLGDRAPCVPELLELSLFRRTTGQPRELANNLAKLLCTKAFIYLQVGIGQRLCMLEEARIQIAAQQCEIVYALDGLVPGGLRVGMRFRRCIGDLRKCSLDPLSFMKDQDARQVAGVIADFNSLSSRPGIAQESLRVNADACIAFVDDPPRFAQKQFTSHLGVERFADDLSHSFIGRHPELGVVFRAIAKLTPGFPCPIYLVEGHGMTAAAHARFDLRDESIDELPPALDDSTPLTVVSFRENEFLLKASERIGKLLCTIDRPPIDVNDFGRTPMQKST